MRVVEATLVLAVAALNFAVVTGRVRPYELVSNAKVSSGLFKERDQVAVRLRETVGKLKTIVCLNAFHGEAMMLEEGICFLQKIGGGKSILLIVSGEVT